jgi:hypothetical protein
VALLEKRGFLYNHSGDFPQVILIVPSHVPNTGFIPSPAGMSLTKLSLDGKNLIIPVQGEFFGQ